MTTKERFFVTLGFCITVPLALVGLLALGWIFWAHHMFILERAK